MAKPATTWAVDLQGNPVVMPNIGTNPALNVPAQKQTGLVDSQGNPAAVPNVGAQVAQPPVVTKTATPPAAKWVVQPNQPILAPVKNPLSVTPGGLTDAQIAAKNAAADANNPGAKPTISPTLQAKIDAKNGTTPATTTPNQTIPPVATAGANAPAQTTSAETKVGADGSKVTTSTTTKTGDTPEMSDAEKAAQASGVAYKMDANGQPVYSPSSKEEAMKILQTGGKLNGEDKLTKVAQDTLNRVRNYAQMTDKQLSQQMVNGSVSPKDVEMLNQVNPALVQRAKDFATKAQITDTTNAIQTDNQAIVDGTVAPIQNKALDNLMQKVQQMDASNETYGEIKTRVYAQYPGMDQARQDIVTGQTQVRELQRSKRQLYDDYKAKNSSLPISMIMSGFSALSRGIDDQIYEANDSLSQNVAIYNSYLDDAKSEIDWNIDKQKNDEDRLWKMYGVQNESDIRDQDMKREDDRITQEIGLEEYRYQRALTDGRTDDATARKQKLDDLHEERDYNMGNQLRSLGVDPTGMSSDEMSKAFAETSNYYNQAELALKQQPKASDFIKSTIEGADGSKRDVFVNPATGQQIDPTATFGTQGKKVDLNTVLWAYSGDAQALLTAPENSVIPTRLGEVSAQNAKIRGKECAEYVNDIAGTKMGNSYDSKKAVCNEDTGNVGSVVAWHPNGSGDYGHAGIIVGDDGNNWLVRSSNLSAGKVTTTSVPKSSIAGYYTPPAVKEAYTKINVTPVQQTILTGIDDLITDPGLNSAVGFGLQKLQWGDQSKDGFLPGTDAEDFRQKFNSFRDNMVLPNLSKLKGSMSDKDVEFLRSSATSLSLSMSESAFKAELNRIREKIMGIWADEY